MSSTEIEKAVFSWSGGKDGAYAIHNVQESEEYEIVELLTTISEPYQRSVHHGVRTELVQRQADELDIPVSLVELPENCANHEYESIMVDNLAGYRSRGIETMVYGDIHLQDIREYREKNLARANLQGYWPLWGTDTVDLVHGFVAAGFKATTVAVDAEKLDRSFVGRELNRTFLDDLPEDVDPAGEQGEFHTFVWDGPIFRHSIPVEVGETVERELGDTTMYYCDLNETT